MRRIRYSVAVSLDGYIAGPKGEFDWIIMDPEIDFQQIFGQFDTMLVGRKTIELIQKQGGPGGYHMKVFVFSRKLRQKDHPEVSILAKDKDIKKTLTAMKKQRGKDIWLFGGGLLFRSLLKLGLVDTVEVTVIPVLVGGGIPLLPPPAGRAKLKLTGHRVYKKTGIVSLEYAVR
jgi:dihydrofolate reductase